MIYKASDLVLGALGVSLISNVVLSSKLRKEEHKNEVRDECLDLMNKSMRNLMTENERLRVEVKVAKKK